MWVGRAGGGILALAIMMLLLDVVTARTAEETEKRMELMKALRERQQQKGATNIGEAGGLSSKQAKAMFEAMKKMYPDLVSKTPSKPKRGSTNLGARKKAKYSQGPDMAEIRARQRKPGDPTSFEQLMQRIAQKDEIDKGEDAEHQDSTTSHLRSLLNRMQQTLSSSSISPNPAIFDPLDPDEDLCVGEDDASDYFMEDEEEEEEEEESEEETEDEEEISPADQTRGVSTSTPMTPAPLPPTTRANEPSADPDQTPSPPPPTSRAKVPPADQSRTAPTPTPTTPSPPTTRAKPAPAKVPTPTPTTPSPPPPASSSTAPTLTKMKLTKSSPLVRKKPTQPSPQPQQPQRSSRDPEIVVSEPLMLDLANNYEDYRHSQSNHPHPHSHPHPHHIHEDFISLEEGILLAAEPGEEQPEQNLFAHKETARSSKRWVPFNE